MSSPYRKNIREFGRCLRNALDSSPASWNTMVPNGSLHHGIKIQEKIDHCYERYGKYQTDAILRELENNLTTISNIPNPPIMSPVGDIKETGDLKSYEIYYAIFRALYATIYITNEIVEGNPTITESFENIPEMSPNLTMQLNFSFENLQVPANVLNLAKRFHDIPQIVDGKNIDAAAKAALIEAIGNLKQGFSNSPGKTRSTILFPNDMEALFILRMGRHFLAQQTELLCIHTINSTNKKIKEITDMQKRVVAGVAALKIAFGGLDVPASAKTAQSAATSIITTTLTKDNERITKEHETILNSMAYQRFTNILGNSKAILAAYIAQADVTDDMKLKMCTTVADDIAKEAENTFIFMQKTIEEKAATNAKMESLEKENRNLKSTILDQGSKIKNQDSKIRSQDIKIKAQDTKIEKLFEMMKNQGAHLNNNLNMHRSKMVASVTEELKFERIKAMMSSRPKHNLNSTQLMELANIWTVIVS